MAALVLFRVTVHCWADICRRRASARRSAGLKAGRYTQTGDALGELIGLARRVRDLGLPGAIALAPALLAFVPYLIVQREAGLRRTLENWTVSASSFLASPSHVHQWLLSFVPNARINETADAYLFPGFLPIALAIVAIVRRRDRQRVVFFYALLTFGSVWLTLGPPIGLWPFVYWLPGLNFIRVPSRFMLLAILGLAVLAGFGVEPRKSHHENTKQRNHEDTKTRKHEEDNKAGWASW